MSRQILLCVETNKTARTDYKYIDATTNVLAKLGKNEHVSTQSLEKICKTLKCEVGDILEFVPDEKEEK